MIEISITHYTDQDGEPMVSVPLTNSPNKVHLYQDDFNGLIERGLDPRWRLENGQVLERGSRISVTRLVANAGQNQKVRLKDKDPCNLKRDNLVITAGGGGKDANTLLSVSDRPHRFDTPKLVHEYINPPIMEIISDHAHGRV